MSPYLFLKADHVTKPAKGVRTQSAPVMDPKLLVLMSARYV